MRLRTDSRSTISSRTRVALAVTASLAFAAGAAACGSDDDAGSSGSIADSVATDTSDQRSNAEPDETVTLVVYDSFPESDTALNDAIDTFSADTGIGVEILVAGDAGTMLAKAALTAGNPEGDVMWGIDNTLISRAIDDDIFEPYTPASVVNGDTPIDNAFIELAPEGVATPVDYGDVCINYDIGWFEEAGIEPPTRLEDLKRDEYADMLVVENPATSSVGLAFLLATIDRWGDDAWQEYWSILRDNGVDVVDGWTQAYYEQFSWAGGPSPLVVSYGSSPPAEVIFADPPREDAPTAVIEDTCFRQVEFAGVLRGTDAPEAARRLVDFLVSAEFQAELPLGLFVYPANQDVELPQEFVDFAVVPDDPASLDPAEIDANRSDWIDEWTTVVLG